jgi:HPr kinase/phosphorylase
MTARIIHATAVAMGGNGVLIIGPSGSGKSDIALRMMDRGAVLVSDDAVGLETKSGSVLLVTAPNIAGKIEMRGIGICNVENIPIAPLRLVVQLTEDVERMPRPGATISIAGYDVPLVRLVPLEPSAPLKLERALQTVVDAGTFPVANEIVETAESTKA